MSSKRTFSEVDEEIPEGFFDLSDVSEEVENIPDNFFDCSAFTIEEELHWNKENFLDFSDFSLERELSTSNDVLDDEFWEIFFKDSCFSQELQTGSGSNGLDERARVSTGAPDVSLGVLAGRRSFAINEGAGPSNAVEPRRSYAINEGAGPSNVVEPGNTYWSVLDNEGPSDMDSAFVLVERARKTIKKFQAEEINYDVIVEESRLPNGVQGADLSSIMDLVRKLFESIISRVSGSLLPTDRVRICLFSDRLDKPISTKLIPVSHMTVETILGCIMKVLQSKDIIFLDEGFSINIVTVHRPRGGGRRKPAVVNVDRLKKRSIVTIDGEESGLCCAKAILLGIAYLDKDPRIKTLSDKRSVMLTDQAMDLHSATHIPSGPCGFEEIKMFEEHLDVQIIVISTESLNKVAYKGRINSRRIYLWLHDNHYDLIRSPKGFYGSNFFCESCDSPYDHVERHRCESLCHVCRRSDCHVGTPTRCIFCLRNCSSEECYIAHQDKRLCDLLYQCPSCCKVIRRKNRAMELHRCGESRCPSCLNFVMEGHRCFLKKVEAKAPSDKLGFYDLETDQSTGEHLVNFAVFQYADGQECVFEGYDALERLCTFMFSPKHKGYTFIAHNMKGFDGQFLLRWMLKQGQTPVVIPQGSKLMSITSLGIRFIDSFNFLPMALSKLPKTFGITELCKGYFPHMFNTPHNQDYVGKIPASVYYSPDFMTPHDRTTFFQWYEERKQYPFNFRKEMLEYCRSDVDILRRCCLEFRSQFLCLTGVDPFCYITIASACMATFRSTHIEQGTIAMVPTHGYSRRTSYSNDSIRWLDYVAAQEDVYIQHALNGSGEHEIDGAFVDGYCETTKTVYQYHGCFYHGCSKCFSPDTVNPLHQCTMGTLYESTQKRTRDLRRIGYTVVEMWEHDFIAAKKTDSQLSIFLEQHEVVDRLNPRDAFFGGRTNATQLFFEGEAKYIDYTSLYPWCNKYCRYPIGHPEIITSGFGEIEQYYGFVKCKILPPRGLYHPVLPYKAGEKLMFPLCKKCCEACLNEECNHTDEERSLLGTWVTDEVTKAVQVGYKIVKVYEIYHFAQSSDKLFRSYIDLFLKTKQEASGWPADCSSVGAREEYVATYLAREGVCLEKDNITFNPGRRAVAKLALNSFWGRWGMNLQKTQLLYVDSLERFNRIMIDSSKQVDDIFFPTEDVCALQWHPKKLFLPQDTSTNIFLAAFTTCHARLKLYSELERLGRRVLYFDTDSLIYSTGPGQSEPPLGNFLGDFTDELDGDIITTFVSGGPKNYAYKTAKGKTVCKIRGFTLNFKNNIILNYNSVKQLVTNLDTKTKIPIHNPHKIVRDAKKRKVLTKQEEKQYRIVYNKRVIQKDYTTVPYGY